jgi:hypothetical protein
VSKTVENRNDVLLVPPRKVQQKDYATCWAACLSELLRVNGAATQYTEKELVATYGDKTDGNKITPAKFAKILDDLGYLYNRLEDSQTVRQTLSDKFLKERLRQTGMMIIMAHVVTDDGKRWFHAQLLYGVTYLTDKDVGTNFALLETMNPALAAYESYPLFWLSQGDTPPVLTCWPKHS